MVDIDAEQYWREVNTYRNAERLYHEANSSNVQKLRNCVPNPIKTQASKKKSCKKHSPSDIAPPPKFQNANNPNSPNCRWSPSTSQCPGSHTNIHAKTEKKKHSKIKEAKATSPSGVHEDSLIGEVQRARQQLRESLKHCEGHFQDNDYRGISARIAAVEQKNADLTKMVHQLSEVLKSVELSLKNLSTVTKTVVSKPSATEQFPPTAPPAESENKSDDDDVDLFGSDSEGEDAAAAKLREERLAAYAAKKSKKPVLIAKSNIIFDVKPWDDSTDMANLEKLVRSVEQEGLLWGASKLVPLAYGIHKLQISCIIEDDKVSVDILQETISEKGSEYVQSIDIAAFNKV